MAKTTQRPFPGHSSSESVSFLLQGASCFHQEVSVRFLLETKSRDLAAVTLKGDLEGREGGSWRWREAGRGRVSGWPARPAQAPHSFHTPLSPRLSALREGPGRMDLGRRLGREARGPGCALQSQGEEGRLPGLQPPQRERRLWIQVPVSGWAAAGMRRGRPCACVLGREAEGTSVHLVIRRESRPRGQSFWPGFEALLPLTVRSGVPRPQGRAQPPDESFCAPRVCGNSENELFKKEQPFIFGF